MIGSVTRWSRSARWLAVAIVGALTGVALQVLVGGSDGSPAVSVVAVNQGLSSSGTGAPVAEPSPAPQSVAGPPHIPAQATEPAGRSAGETPAAGPAAVAAPVASQPVASGLRLRIPTLGIDAQIVTLGFTGDGQLDVPHNGSSVGWYDISPRPGEAGNALLGAHFDWDGALAVFAGLSQLSPGDLVFIDSGSAAQVAYEVSVATSVGWDHPVADVLAANGAESSLTLFTCGGNFDTERSEYDERLVVRAVQTEVSASLAVRR